MKTIGSFIVVVLAMVMMVGCGVFGDGVYSSGGSEKRPYIPGTEGQKEVKVQVLDATTMQPIEGAIVVGGYYGPDSTGGYSCAKSESAVSDAQGWALLPNDQDERIGGRVPRLFGPDLETAYKRGYQLVYPIYMAARWDYNDWYISKKKLAPRTGNWPSEIPSSEPKKIYDKHKDALLASKERSTIYLMPSTAKTMDERLSELKEMGWGGGVCLIYPFLLPNPKADLLP